VTGLNDEYEQKLWDYIEALETINGELLNALKKCVELVEHIKGVVPDPGALQGMLDVLHETIHAAERPSDSGGHRQQ